MYAKYAADDIVKPFVKYALVLGQVHQLSIKVKQMKQTRYALSLSIKKATDFTAA